MPWTKSLFNIRTHLLIQTFVGLVTASVCAVIAWYGSTWVYLDFVDGLTAFSGTPAWALEIIIPLSFAIISIRYLILSMNWFYQFLHPSQLANESV